MREVLLPGLRKAFDDAYVTEKLAEIAARRNLALERLAQRRNDPDRNYLYLDVDKTRARTAWRTPDKVEPYRYENYPGELYGMQSVEVFPEIKEDE